MSAREGSFAAFFLQSISVWSGIPHQLHLLEEEEDSLSLLPPFGFPLPFFPLFFPFCFFSSSVFGLNDVDDRDGGDEAR